MICLLRFEVTQLLSCHRGLQVKSSVHIGKPQRSTLLVGLTVLLLCVLAVLQYRWVDELSAFELEERKRTLATSAEGVVRSLDRELQGIQSAFRVPRSFREEPADILEDYRDWAESFEFPELITDVFWVEETDPSRQTGDGLGLRRLNLELERLEAANWDSRLTALADQLVGLSDGSGGSRYRVARRLTGKSFGDGPFVLVAAQPDRRFEGWVLVFLNRQILVERFIPFVVDEHFGLADQRDYDVWITHSVDMSDRSLIYNSNSDLSPEERTSPDILRELDDDDRPNWVVAARHRAGSLEAFVDQYRRRNLSLSLGALMVLGASVVPLLIATKRERSMAQRQMDLVAGVSHELRTPIAGICSLSQNLADGVVEDAEGARRYGDSISREGRRLSNIVESVLRFSAMRSDRFRHHSAPIDFQAIIDSEIDSELEVWRESSSEGPHLVRHIDTDLPAVLGDAQALKSMVRNLVGNAMKFTAAGGEVRVWAGRAHGRGPEQIEFRVEDQGPGIEKADLEHVFEPFYRGRSARDAQVSGSGLGLSLVKEIVDAHGGRIGLTSSPESGTVFSVYLPVAGPGNDASPYRSRDGPEKAALFGIKRLTRTFQTPNKGGPYDDRV